MRQSAVGRQLHIRLSTNGMSNSSLQEKRASLLANLGPNKCADEEAERYNEERFSRTRVARGEQTHNIRVLRQIGETTVGQCLLPSEHVRLPKELSGDELIVAEWLHLGYFDSTDAEERKLVAGVLGIDQNDQKRQKRFEEICAIIEDDVERSSQLYVDLTKEALGDQEFLDEFAKELSDDYGAKIELSTEMSPIVMSTITMMMTGHEGQMREDGKKYETHPLTTMFLFQIAWDMVVEEWSRNYPERDIPKRHILFDQLAVNGAHDVVEDLFPYGKEIINGQSIMTGDNAHVTPLVLKSVYKKHKVGSDSEGDAPEELVEANRILTKTRDIDGETIDKEEYVDDCMSSVLTIFAKLCDTLHNKVMNAKSKDGKSKEDHDHIDKSHEEYERSLRMFTERIIDNENDWDAAIVKKLWFIANLPNEKFIELIEQTKLGSLEPAVYRPLE